MHWWYFNRYISIYCMGTIFFIFYFFLKFVCTYKNVADAKRVLWIVDVRRVLLWQCNICAILRIIQFHLVCNKASPRIALKHSETLNMSDSSEICSNEARVPPPVILTDAAEIRKENWEFNYKGSEGESSKGRGRGAFPGYCKKSCYLNSDRWRKSIERNVFMLLKQGCFWKYLPIYHLCNEINPSFFRLSLWKAFLYD